MSDLGRRLRQALDEVAPPVDLDRIVAHKPSLPFWRIGRALAYAAILVAVVGMTVVLLSRDISDDTAVDSSVTTVDETVTTLGEGAASSLPSTQGVELDTSHLTGEWYRTEPDTEGLMVITNDTIWDGEAFYVLTRLGFGDHVVWRSIDGVEWERYRTIAAAGELGSGVDVGPLEILSVDGRLIGAGTAAGRATVWIDDGASGWSAIDLGRGGVDSLVYHEGRYVALGYSAYLRTDEAFDDRIPIVWVSDDGESWEPVATEEIFGPGESVSGLVTGPAGLLAIVSEPDDPVDPTSAVSSVVMSDDGESWSKIDPTGLAPRVSSVVGGDFGYAALAAHRVFTSTDGVTWVELNDVFPPEIEALQDSQVHPQGLGLVGDHLVMVGGIGFVPEGSEFNTAHPRVWSYGGHGWIKVGEFDWFDRPGFAYSVVGGDGVMLVQAETQVDGPEEWALFTFVPEEAVHPIDVARPPYSDGECSAADLGPFRDDHLLDAQLLDRAAATRQTRLALIDAAIACDFETVAAMASSDWPENEFGWGSFWGGDGLTAERLRELDATDHAMWDLAVALIYTEPYWEFSECEDPGTTAWYCGREWYEWPPIRGAGDYPQEWLDRIGLLEGLPPDQLNDRLRGGHRPFGVVITTSGEWVAAHPRVVPDPVTLHLYVSNQSFDLDPVRIVVSADGAVVIDDEFYVEGQHNWILHDLELAPGPLQIRAVDPEMGAVLQIEVDLTSESWAVLDFWFTTEDGVPYFRLPGLLDGPPAFL